MHSASFPPTRWWNALKLLPLEIHQVLLIAGCDSYSELWFHQECSKLDRQYLLVSGSRSRARFFRDAIARRYSRMERPGLVKRSVEAPSQCSVLTAWGRGRGAVREPGRAAGMRGSPASLLFTVEFHVVYPWLHYPDFSCFFSSWCVFTNIK